MSKLKQMKWWGWGDENKDFDHIKRPYFWDYVQSSVGIENVKLTPPVKFSQITINDTILVENQNKELLKFLNKSQIKIDKLSRIEHAYGKSYRDLLRARNGKFNIVPDVVLFPKSSKDVQNILQFATNHDALVIPFGGGSNIVGGVEFVKRSKKLKISVDMKLMNKLIDLDRLSMQATFGAGILGPDLEERLAHYDMTLGHFPDSFQFSTLGGWVATRSAGMQSDKYGKIEDMVIGLKLITPQGEMIVRATPKSSNGIDLKHMIIGSEGILGIISEITVKVHEKPKRRKIVGFFFPDFESGVKAILKGKRAGISPSLLRLNDSEKTRMSLAFKEKSMPHKKVISNLIKNYLGNVKRYDLDKLCMLLVGFEGSKKEIDQQYEKLEKIYKSAGAFALGEGVSKTFDETKYDFPYVRDFIMDHNCVADVSETATNWDNLLNLYNKVRNGVLALEKELNRKILIACHISHTYHTGASLYFTWGAQALGSDHLKCYDLIKSKTEELFVKYDATVSHHHAVGYEHKKWLKEEIGELGISTIKHMKKSVDKSNMMNPGKII